MKKMSRRKFLADSASLGAVLGLPVIVPSSALGRDGHVAPSDRVAVGLVGCGDRSKFASQFQNYSKCQVAAVCDPVLDRRLQRKKEYGNCPDYSDFRKLLESEAIDAVYISTGDHWHVPISLAAARAGKDMYTEKPMSPCIAHTLAARQITAKYNRVFQYGTQNRSMAQVRMGTELVLNGHIGDVQEIYVWAPEGLAEAGPVPELPVPDGWDYDMWLGPAPRAPFSEARCLRTAGQNGIFYIYDYSIGFMAGWGAHTLDQLQWWADAEGLGIPVKYKGTGVIPAGLFNTVANWDVTCTYASGLKMRFLDNQTARKNASIPHIEEIPFDHGTLYIGTKGWIVVARGDWKSSPADLLKKGRDPGPRRLIESTSHPANFIDCVISRERPISPLESAIQSDLVSHLGNIAIRTGREITWNPQHETIVGDEEAARMMVRPMREPWNLI